MKKVIISLLLVSLVCVSAFAIPPCGVNGVSVAANLAVDNGVKFDSVGAFADVSLPYVDANVGFMYSLDKNPGISGLYVDVYQNDESSLEYFATELGLSADFHMVKGVVKANLATVLYSEVLAMSAITDSVFLYVSPRFTLINNTGIAPVSARLELFYEPAI